MRKRFFLNCLLMLTLVLVMSTSAFAISESDVESTVSASGKEAVSGNVLVWFLCAIAFLKVSQKIDSFLSSLGLNVGHIAALYHTSSNNVGAWISRAAKRLRSDPDFLDAFDIAC